jgi:hypothetical protein
LPERSLTHFDARNVCGDESRPIGDLLRAAKRLLR